MDFADSEVSAVVAADFDISPAVVVGSGMHLCIPAVVLAGMPACKLADGTWLPRV